VRLAKFLAGAGVASRRASEEIVRAGRVTVGGALVTDPAFDVGEGQGDPDVAVDGRAVSPGTGGGRLVFAVNKPAGVVSTASDPQRRPTIVSLVPAGGRRLYPVGRLDIDATGLILLTDDGDLAHRLTHPSFEVDKTYRVVVAKGPVRERSLRALRDGIVLEDGPTAPARVRRVTDDTLEITIHEGRKRQVKRMCEAVGHPVIRLERVRFGPLLLGELAPGRYRRLGEDEVSLLRSAGSGDRRASGSSSAGRRTRRHGSGAAGGRRPAGGS
jgi:23S rRNA pseudouridine2605 synthase